MSDWATMIATIRERANKGASENNRIQRQICDSIALHRRERLRGNQAQMAVTLSTGFGAYGVTASTGVAAGLPNDVVLPVPVVDADLDYRGVATSRVPISWRSWEQIQDYRRGNLFNGQPRYWTWRQDRLEVWPPSDNSTNIFRVAYIKDIGTPSYKLVAGVWKFYRPKSVTELTTIDTYTSAWFDQEQGFNVIAEHALWQLWAGIWQATAGQDQQAATRYAEALAAQREITEGQRDPRFLRPYNPNDGCDSWAVAGLEKVEG